MQQRRFQGFPPSLFRSLAELANNNRDKQRQQQQGMVRSDSGKRSFPDRGQAMAPDLCPLWLFWDQRGLRRDRDPYCDNAARLAPPLIKGGKELR